MSTVALQSIAIWIVANNIATLYHYLQAVSIHKHANKINDLSCHVIVSYGEKTKPWTQLFSTTVSIVHVTSVLACEVADAQANSSL